MGFSNLFNKIFYDLKPGTICVATSNTPLPTTHCLARHYGNKESAESTTSLYISTFNQLSPIISNPNRPDLRVLVPTQHILQEQQALLDEGVGELVLADVFGEHAHEVDALDLDEFGVAGGVRAGVDEEGLDRVDHQVEVGVEGGLGGADR